MRRLWPLGFALLVAGCGGEQEVPAANVARPQASAPIIADNEGANPIAENVPEAVLPETAEQPLPSPTPERPVSHSSTGEGYRAIGTEPFWAVTVKGNRATLERPDKAATHYAVSRNGDGRAIRYLGDGFSMTVTEGPCSDGMSDAIWQDRVALAFGEGTLKGCGGLRVDQGAP